jgi:hypothetical protein
LWDECLAAFYRDRGAITVDQLYTGVIEPWLELRREYTSQQNDADMLEEEDREVAALTRGMLDGYLAEYASDMAKYEVIAVKAQMARYLYNPETGEPLNDEVDGVIRHWAGGGEVDMIVRCRVPVTANGVLFDAGEYLVVENKTTAETDWHSIFRKLAWSPQVRRYAWACAAPINHPDMDVREPLDIAGVIYNVARKGIPRVPEPLKKTPSRLSVAAIDTTLPVYLAAIRKHGFNPDHYADKLESLRGRTFFARHAVRFTAEDLEAYGFEVSHRAMEIMAEQHKPHHTAQESVCTGVAAFPCQYAPICHDNAASRAGFSVRGIRHDELRGVMAEPYVAQQRKAQQRD